jgi:D-alanyl-lipoteichoic acid acyltransferase DltB (MBOAT superfamily)
MTFASLTFLVFLALVFALYWSIRRRKLQNGLLIVAGYFFYAWWDWRFCGLLLASSVLDFTLGLALGRQQKPAARKFLLWTSVAANLGLLGFFKYFNFFADTFRATAESLGWHLSPPTLHVLLPAGISFYTFQSLGYVIDIYRGAARPVTRLVDYLAFVSFFPQLVAGPIERAGHLLPQFERDRVFDLEAAVDGCRQILWGLFKKILISDTLGEVADAAYGSPGLYSGPALAGATVCFSIQIYCDFSGYSDVALGTAKLFGFRLMRNFAYPYFSQNPLEFWRRWHISLSTWFRDYLFIPLGGSRVGPGRLAFNVLATFVLSGLWHGAQWTFIVWGLLHGLAVLPFMLLRRSASLKGTQTPAETPTAAAVAGMIVTFCFVSLAWVFFRSRTLAEALLICGRVAGLVAAPVLPAALPQPLPGMSLAILMAGLLLVEWQQRRQEHPLHLDRQPRWLRWAAYTALIWGSVLLGSAESRPFIYFQF